MAGTVYGSQYSMAALADMCGYGQTNINLQTLSGSSDNNIILPDDFSCTIAKSGPETYEDDVQETISVGGGSPGTYADQWYNDATRFVWNLSGEYHCSVSMVAGSNVRTKLVTADVLTYESGTFTITCTFYYNVHTFFGISDTITWNCTVYAP